MLSCCTSSMLLQSFVGPGAHKGRCRWDRAVFHLESVNQSNSSLVSWPHILTNTLVCCQQSRAHHCFARVYHVACDSNLAWVLISQTPTPFHPVPLFPTSKEEAPQAMWVASADPVAEVSLSSVVVLQAPPTIPACSAARQEQT